MTDELKNTKRACAELERNQELNSFNQDTFEKTSQAHIHRLSQIIEEHRKTAEHSKQKFQNLVSDLNQQNTALQQEIVMLKNVCRKQEEKCSFLEINLDNLQQKVDFFKKKISEGQASHNEVKEGKMRLMKQLVILRQEILDLKEQFRCVKLKSFVLNDLGIQEEIKSKILRSILERFGKCLVDQHLSQ